MRPRPVAQLIRPTAMAKRAADMTESCDSPCGKKMCDSDEAKFPGMPENLKKHCFKFEAVAKDDPLGIPQPKYFYRAGGVMTMFLCHECCTVGRKMNVQVLGEGRHGVVVPLCRTCSKVNHRIGQSIFYGTVIKSLVDDENKRLEQVNEGGEEKEKKDE